MQDAELIRYYGCRAPEYEEIYRREDPEHQAELRRIAEEMKQHLGGRRVLEVACGTGYWTAVLADAVQLIVATDAAPETLTLAREKALSRDRVTFLQRDAFSLSDIEGTFDGGLAMFWLSHVPRDRLDEFLEGFHQRLERSAAVFVADNNYVPGMGGDLVERAGTKDTFKRRTLRDGSTHEVLKNYHDPEELHAILSPRASDLSIHFGRFYWWASYLTS